MTLEFDEVNFVVEENKTKALLTNWSKKSEIYALKDNNLYALIVAYDWNTSDNIDILD